MPDKIDVKAWWLSDPTLARPEALRRVTRHSSLVTAPSADLRPDPALLTEGWERRFTADASRAAEAMELYAQLGYEVRAESLHHQEKSGGHTDECEGCCSSVTLEFKTIYTRKKKS